MIDSKVFAIVFWPAFFLRQQQKPQITLSNYQTQEIGKTVFKFFRNNIINKSSKWLIRKQLDNS